MPQRAETSRRARTGPHFRIVTGVIHSSDAVADAAPGTELLNAHLVMYDMDSLTLILVAVVWFAAVRWVLPRMGVAT